MAGANIDGGSDYLYLHKIADGATVRDWVFPVITWDQAKRRSNLAKHGLDFRDVVDFDFQTALIHVDDREDYGETREIAIGWCGARLCVVVFVRRDEKIRVISFRRATKPEMRHYAQS